MEQCKTRLKTALYDRHVQLGAKMVDFCEWEMPIQYSSILQECQAVRNNVGLFDVSHMGRIHVSGNDAESFLDYLSTNRITGKKDGSATYTVWCHAKGGCVDDVIIYRIDSTHFFVIVNAGNRQKDLEHLQKESKPFDVTLQDHFDTDGILAIQGPQALSLVSKHIPEAQTLKPMHFLQLGDIILSGTGYTGAGGCEIYGPHAEIVSFWDAFIKSGAEPVGLGARDTLRLEMGFALYGHELSDSIAPIESVANWTVKLDKENFLGKQALLDIKNRRNSYGIILQERGVPREGYDLIQNEKKIGYVTSGTHSPTLNAGIAMIIVDKPLQIGDSIFVQIRNKQLPAKVVKLPFI